ncbi:MULTISPECIES: L,D-transpeptidase [unclassified Mesorhizobium]|uniref:L,D-transpeptidase n=1 Tax=unclassified Mesorhizobium TaxID=325217 RepID=UPI000FCBF22A|nr:MULTISPECIES: L,D-transpeptidase [unclassified Mesorhizobium]RUV41737.1 L,D-transpeptidase [Mesorhizobium sp. M1A.T.Ca.IN.004.03.1.1]RWK37774.1 MAG: L,D-transpeptidase [Mesorhizobium sp.]RWK86041.1 MAG: L,D-transpeptidase [Mesorhizobium sp.]TIP19973.1 MAG: L,D-transpeptidase [Mesorhizobium sp.]TJV80399.1 MAG: L,D-transpeptidase [Mesorhizobium sp.]
MRELPQSLTPPSSGETVETEVPLSRRAMLSGMGAMALLGMAGCGTTDTLDLPQLQIDDTTTGSVPIRPAISVDKNITGPDVMYAALTDNGFQVPAVPYQKIKPEFRRQIVVDKTGEAPGTIVVHLQERMLYLVQPGGDAIRYGVGIGKDGFRWSGRANIQYGKEWPVWTPPPEMVKRKPELVKWQGGQPGGLTNPLGARALYIYQNGKDTGYRFHGSPEWWTIGQAMSSGCVRLINQDIIDLYNRVSKKNPVVVVV